MRGVRPDRTHAWRAAHPVQRLIADLAPDKIGAALALQGAPRRARRRRSGS
jgi:hypothetical protein